MCTSLVVESATLAAASTLRSVAAADAAPAAVARLSVAAAAAAPAAIAGIVAAFAVTLPRLTVLSRKLPNPKLPNPVPHSC